MEPLFKYASAAALVSAIVVALHVRARRRPKRVLSDVSARLLAQGQRKLVHKLLDVAGFFGTDIGGSLTKLVFFAPDKDLVGRMLRRVSPAHAAEAGWHSKLASVQQIEAFILSRTVYGGTGVRDAHLSFHMAELGGSFHFIRFETHRMQGALRMAAAAKLNAGMHTLFATGGGAMKFAPAAASMLGIHLEARDEIDCLLMGMAFLMAHIAAEAYTFKGATLVDRTFSEGIQYPYLVVNIGSGVGFILVTSETKWERVGGTSLGGGTYYGLMRSLTGVASFDDMLALAEIGESSAVDLTVGDIYGGDYARFGLKASTIAASFGKAVTWPRSDPSAESRMRSGTSAGASEDALVVEGQDDGSYSTIGGPGVRRSNMLRLPEPAGRKSGRPSWRDGYATPLRGSVERHLHALAPDETPSAASSSGAGAKLRGRLPSDCASDVPPVVTAEGVLPPDITAAGTPVGGGSSRVGGQSSKSAESTDPRSPARPRDPSLPDLKASDISRSILIMLSNNLGQLASLHAQRHKCKNVFFAGNFLRHENTIAMRTLAYAIQFWSKGGMEGLFLRHEGYCGALGAFLATLESADEPA